MEEISKKIGFRIRMLRKNLGLSQIGLAEKIGLSFQQIQKYEKGQTKITVDRLVQISTILNVPLHFFLKEEEPASKVSDAAQVYAADKSQKIYSQSLSKEELNFIKVLRHINNRKAKEGLMKLMKGIAELENNR